MTEEKLSLQQWIQEAEAQKVSFADYCISRQAEEMEITPTQLLDKMTSMLTVMQESIRAGLSGLKSKGGLVGGDAAKLQQYFAEERSHMIFGKTMSKAIMIAVAVGEANASMGRIVAAPTAGSSGVIPAILFSLKEEKDFSTEQLATALVVAGVVGMIIASRASLSGAEGGCQAECGSAGAMAAAAVVALFHGTARQIGNAVAITLKNMLGLVCDPVAGLVEVPCVKRNAGAAAQAMVGAQMALAGVDSVIPVDEVIDAMAAIGLSMPCSLKETAQGGLAATPTGLRLAKKIFVAEE